MERSSIALLAVLATLAACAPVPPAVAAAPPGADPASTLDSAWHTILASHPDPAFDTAGWTAVRAELRPHAAAAQNEEELRTVIRTMLGRLGQSHFALIPRERRGDLPAEGAGRQPGEVGLDVRLVGETMVVWSVAPGSPAAGAGIQAGWTLEEVEETPVRTALEETGRAEHWLRPSYRARAWVLRRLRGEPGTAVRLRLRTGEDAIVERTLRRAPLAGTAVEFGHYERRHVRLDTVRVRDPRSDAVAGVIRFDAWMMPLMPELHRAVHAFRNADGIVLDLRGNPGGAGAMVGGVAGLFVDRPARLGTIYMRRDTIHHSALPRRVSPDGEPAAPYAGPLAILVDETSGSASETFAAGMQAIGRARVFGRPSAGGVLPSHTRELPNGDVLQYAVGEYRTPDGRRLEGRGVQPDSVVPVQLAALRAGRDADLEAALSWIAAARTAELPPADSLYRRYVEATGGRAAYEALRGYRAEGRLEIRPVGLRGTLTLAVASPDRSASRTELQGIGTIRSGFTESVAWTLNPATGPLVLEGDPREQAKQQADLQAVLHPERYNESMTTMERTRFEEQDAYRVRIRTRWGAEYDEYFDAGSGLMLGTVRRQETPAGAVNATTLYQEYREVAGVRMPMRIVQRAAGMEQVIEFERIEPIVAEPALFELPREVRALLEGR